MTAPGGKKAAMAAALGLSAPMAGDVPLFSNAAGADAVPAAREPVESRPHEPVTSRRREPVESRRRFSAPTAAEATSYTLRLDLGDAMEVDALRAALRRVTGGRALDQSAIVRALLLLAIDDETVRAALIRELTS